MTRALLALLATLAALTAAGCGGSSDTEGFSDADRDRIAALEKDTLAYAAAADSITARFDDASLSAKQLRTESREDLDALDDIAAGLVDDSAQVDNDAFRSLAEPAARFYVEDAGQVRDLIDAYAANDPERTAELTVEAQRTKEEFLTAQRRRLAAAEEDLPEADYNRLRAAFAASG